MRYTFTPRFGSPAGRAETPRTGSDRVLHGEHHLAPSSHLKAVLHKSPPGTWRWASTEHASPAPLVRSMICVDSGSQVSCLQSSSMGKLPHDLWDGPGAQPPENRSRSCIV